MIGTVAYSGTHRIPWVLDTGDDIVALGAALGRTGLSLAATKWLDRLGERSAADIVVRGRTHCDLYRDRGLQATWIPDGVDVAQFAVATNRSEPAEDVPLLLGVLGSSHWNGAGVPFYGLDLVDVVCELASGPDFPFSVRGLMIGDGSGIPILKQMLRDRGAEHLVTFLGRRDYDDLPALLTSMHICLSTQTDDNVGAVRTTGKLPLYLAAGRFVLASNVGEASRILPPSMLVPYVGTKDDMYAGKVAERIRELIHSNASFSVRPECVELARAHFDYDILAVRYDDLIATLLRQD